MGLAARKMEALYIMLSGRYAFFGLGVHAFNRLGPEAFIPNYHIICFNDSIDNDLIRKRIPLYSLEEATGKRSFKKNATSLLRCGEVCDYIKTNAKGKIPVIIVYKSSLAMERICKKEGFLLAANPYRYTKPWLEDKLRFRTILKSLKLPYPPYEPISHEKDVDEQFQKTKNTLGLPFLLQLVFGGGGRGNSLISSAHEFAKCLEIIKKTYPRGRIENALFASKLIQGWSPSLTAAVTKFGTIHTPLQMQIIDARETLREALLRFGIFCGHDFGISFSPAVKRQADAYIKKLGAYMHSQGYRGIFGLDFLWEKETDILYFIEANPRFLGTFPTLFYEEIRQGMPPFILFHILEFLSLRKEESVLAKEAINAWEKESSLPSNYEKSAHIFLQNRLKAEVSVTKTLRPGIYQLGEKGLTFKKPSYNPLHIVSKKEFLICDGVPRRGALIKKDQRLLRIIFAKGILEEDKKTLTRETKRVIQAVYQSLVLESV